MLHEPNGGPSGKMARMWKPNLSCELEARQDQDAAEEILYSARRSASAGCMRPRYSSSLPGPRSIKKKKTRHMIGIPGRTELSVRAMPRRPRSSARRRMSSTLMSGCW